MLWNAASEPPGGHPGRQVGDQSVFTRMTLNVIFFLWADLTHVRMRPQATVRLSAINPQNMISSFVECKLKCPATRTSRMPETTMDTEIDPPKTGSAKTIVRVSVGLILAVLLVLAVMDRSANTSANSTTDAWRKELKAAAGENRQVSPTELTQHVVGEPETSGEPADGLIVYTWNGTFRSYKTTVMCAEQQGDTIIVDVEGPSL